MSKLKHGLFLTHHPDKKNPGQIIAVISDGSPQRGHSDVTVLDVGRFDSVDAARAWFREMQITKPWAVANSNRKPE